MPELIVNGVNLTEFTDFAHMVTRYIIGNGLEQIEKLCSLHDIDKDSDFFVELRKLYMDMVNEQKRRIISYFLKNE